MCKQVDEVPRAIFDPRSSPAQVEALADEMSASQTQLLEETISHHKD